jgi:hypothetical protein
MKWEEVVTLVSREPVFSSGLLLAGRVSPARIRQQLSRWTTSGRRMQLRRGLYAPGAAWRKTEPHPFLIANALQRGSYVSMQSALAFHGNIPEHVPEVTSVGPGRSETIQTPFGRFGFKHQSDARRGEYSRLEVAPGQWAFVASAAKALLDLVYLTPGADSPEYLTELRLQNLETIDPATLRRLAEQSGKPKLIRASGLVAAMIESEDGEFL